MRTLSLKQTIIAGAIAVAAAAAALGVVAAQQAPPSTQQPAPQSGRGPNDRAAAWREQHEKYLAAVAARLNVKPEQLKQAFADARKEMGWPERGPGGPGGPGGPRAHGPGPGGPHAGGPMGAFLDTAAKTIGIGVDDLRQELRGGKSIADVAKSKNVDPAKVTEALTKQMSDHLDQAVKDNKLSAERAAEMKKNLAQRIDQMVNRSMPAGPGRQGPPRPTGQRS